MATTSREIVQNGVATFFGGPTFDNPSRSYRGAVPAALSSAGLSTVRTHQSKRVGDAEYTLASAAGRGMGAYMVVEARQTGDNRYCIPAGTGRRKLTYRIVLHIFHLAHKAYAEDAEADVNGVCEAIEDYVHGDPTLGGICYQAGESRYGIRLNIPPSKMGEDEVTGTHAQMSFETQVMIIA